MTDLHAALQALNRAAYAAQSAYLDHMKQNGTTLPSLNSEYATLREICAATDKLVDDNAPKIEREVHDPTDPFDRMYENEVEK